MKSSLLQRLRRCFMANIKSLIEGRVVTFTYIKDIRRVVTFTYIKDIRRVVTFTYIKGKRRVGVFVCGYGTRTYIDLFN